MILKNKNNFLFRYSLLALACAAYQASAASSPGISIGQGNVSLTGADIAATGSDNAVEIYNPAMSGHGYVTLVDSTLSSEQGDAVYLLSGDISLTNSTVTTQGGMGINVNNDSNALIRGGSVTTLGNNASGLWLARGDSTADVDGTHFTTSGSMSHAFEAQYGNAKLNHSVLNTSGLGSYGLYTEASVEGEDNEITTSGDSGIGVFAARGGVIKLNNSQITTAGASAAGLLAYPGSTIQGDNLTVNVSGNNSPALWAREGTLALSHSQISATGQSGAGLLVTSSTAGNASQISLTGSQLSSANGPAIQVNSNALADINLLNGSQLLGDVLAASGSLVNLNFTDASGLTGAVNGVEQLSLDGNSRWTMTGSSALNQLHTDGVVEFSASGGFKTLSLGSLSGNGDFSLNTDLAALKGDLIAVSGQAAGNHQLRINNSGLEPANPADLTVVTTGGGSGKFALYGGLVDAGAYSYRLQQQGDNWALVPYTSGGGGRGGDGGDNGAILPSPTAASALGIVNALPVAWFSELTTLRSRMGDVRQGLSSGGAWAQTTGGETRVNNGAGVDYRQTQQGVTAGIDGIHSFDNGRLLTGLFSGVGNTRLNFDRGSRGKVNSFTVGAYGTWLQNDGWFTDAVMKLNNFASRADAVMSDGTKTHGGFNVPGLGLSLEAGKHIKLNDGWFVEPSVQGATLWTKGEAFRFDNGLQADSGSTRSEQLAAHLSAGKDLQLQNGVVLQPWARVSLVQTFRGNNQMNINHHGFDNDLAGTQGVFALGAAAMLRADTQVYAEASTSQGERVSSPWSGMLGVRWSW
ncbi:autotransporter outer membrane beta-barrel domain-containing protein [Cedecea neteri]|uniref:autotransporter outer membrane beta-barrel domain-containing protein n=1 Tax=Cedecea neteri TaxID=158822 RepID=UPI00068A9B08|nr:autotransporter outer membrane beta-barrel domain-containing protein [Cedecea neteri]